jgi:hypothetical protein
MGLLGKLFGGQRKAPNNGKFKVIKDLVKKRIMNEPDSPISIGEVDYLPEEVLIGLPEATLYWIVENYLLIKGQGQFNDAEILQQIENHRTTNMGGLTGGLPEQLNLKSYIKYRLKLEHQDGTPSDELLEVGIQEAVQEISK